MKYQVTAYSNGQIYLLELDDTKIKVKAQRWMQPEGPLGSVGKMITPEAARADAEKAVDLSLGGVISKNKEEI